MEITRLQCPTCGAGVKVVQGAIRAYCEFCHSAFAIQVDHGEIVLHAIEQVTDAVREEGQRTQYALARMELWQSRVQVATDLAAATTRLQNLGAELRGLRRMTQDRTVEWQIQEVQAQRSKVEADCDSWQQTLAAIDNALNLHDAKAELREQPSTIEDAGEVSPGMSWAIWSRRGSIFRTIIVVIVALFVALQLFTLIYTPLGWMPNGRIAEGAPQNVATFLLIFTFILGIIIGWNPQRLLRASRGTDTTSRANGSGKPVTSAALSSPITHED